MVFPLTAYLYVTQIRDKQIVAPMKICSKTKYMTSTHFSDLLRAYVHNASGMIQVSIALCAVFSFNASLTLAAFRIQRIRERSLISIFVVPFQ